MSPEVGPLKVSPPAMGSSSGAANVSCVTPQITAAVTEASALDAARRGRTRPRSCSKSMRWRDVIRTTPTGQLLDAPIRTWLTSPSHGSFPDQARLGDGPGPCRGPRRLQPSELGEHPALEDDREGSRAPARD